MAAANRATLWRTASLLLLALTAGLWISFEPFWTRSMFNGFTALLLLFTGIAFWKPGLAVSALGAAIVLAGNHPGSRYQEVLDLFLIVLLAGTIWRGQQAGTQFSLVWLSFLAAAAASLAAGSAHAYLAGSRLDAFYFFSAAETSPHYPFRIFAWISLVGLLIHSAGPAKFTRDFSTGLLFSLIAACLLALFEAAIPDLRAALDTWHAGIDNSVDRAVARSPWKQLSGGLLTHASNSFFWNRTWFAAFLTAAFGLAASAGRFRGAVLVLAPLSMILSGSRGGFAALCAVTVSLIWFRTGRLPWLPFIAASLIHLLSPLLVVVPGLLAERAVQFEAAALLFESAPLFGHGVESYGIHAFADRPVLSAIALFGTSHNQWLQVLSGMGILGAAVYAACMTAAYRSAGNVWLRAGLIGVSVHSGFQEFWYSPSVHLVWWVLIAACLTEPLRIRWRVFAAAAAVLLALAILVRGRGREFNVVSAARIQTPGLLTWKANVHDRRVLAYPARPFSAGGFILVVDGGPPFALGDEQIEILSLFYGTQTYPLDAEIEILEREGRFYLRARCNEPAGYERKGNRNPAKSCFWIKPRLDRRNDLTTKSRAVPP